MMGERIIKSFKNLPPLATWKTKYNNLAAVDKIQKYSNTNNITTMKNFR